MDAPRWMPNVFIVGAPKAGTSSLHAWIADHPDAFGSVEKETYFFVDPGTHMHRPDFHVSNGLDGYAEQFPLPAHASPRVILEATPSYMYNACALERIPDLPTRPRCMFVLREPAAQIYSLYRYFRDNWNWVPADMTFRDFLAAARTGDHAFGGNELARNALSYARYAEHLAPWRDRLGPERMLVLTFDELARDPAAFIARVAAWLDLDPGFYADYAFPRENETYAPRVRAVQDVNVAIRGLLPKGPVYDALRSLYRRINTRRPDGPSEEENALMETLRAEFTPFNKDLADDFGIDVARWS